MEILKIVSKYVRNKLKKIDIFGKPIMFNYNKKGEYFNTSFGGFLSLIINVTVICYGTYRCIVLNNKSNSNINSVQQFVDQNSFGRINMNKTDILFFI